MNFAIDTHFLRKSALVAALQCAPSADRFIIPAFSMPSMSSLSSFPPKNRLPLISKLPRP